MEPVTMILSALLAGAAAASGETAKQAVKDAYAGLRALIVRKYSRAEAPIAKVEGDPKSSEAQEALRRELAAPADDAEIVEHATKVAQLVRDHAPERAAKAGIDVSDVVASGNVILSRLRTQSVSASHVRAGGDFVLSDVDTTPKE
jgi:hypothetical protein